MSDCVFTTAYSSGNVWNAAIQKDLHAELARLRTELKVPNPDPPESLIVPKQELPKKK